MKTKAVLILLLSLLLYILAPKHYDFIYCLVLFILFIFNVYLIVKDDFKQRFYLSFNILFSISFFLTVFSYPIFIYYLDNVILFGIKSVNENVITKSTALAQLAFSAYSCAFLIKYHGKNIIVKKSNNHIDKSKAFKQITTLLFTFFLCYYVYDYILLLRQEPDTINISSNSIALITQLSLIIVVTSFFRLKNKNVSIGQIINNNLVFYIGILLIFASLLYIGDRGPIITIGLLLVSAYVYYLKRIKIKYIVPLIISAIVFLFLIGNTRTTDSSIRESGVSSLFIQERQDSFWNYFSDLTSISRNLYNGYEYRMNNELYYPGKILIIAVSPIPYFPTILSNLAYSKNYGDISSGILLTSYGFDLMGVYGKGGLGTQCVADIFISWGIIGVLIIFYLLGYLIAFTQKQLNNSIYAGLFYFSYVADAVYIPRDTIFNTYSSFGRAVMIYAILIFLLSRKYQN